MTTICKPCGLKLIWPWRHLILLTRTAMEQIGNQTQTTIGTNAPAAASQTKQLPIWKQRTEKGYTGDKVCKVCGYTVKGKEIPVSGTTKPTNPTKPDGNTDVTSPKTGDNSNLALWFAVLFISCSGVIGVTVYSRCRKLNKRWQRKERTHCEKVKKAYEEKV